MCRFDPDEFYILGSRQAAHVPPLYAAEMTPFDRLVGEFRVHNGFFDLRLRPCLRRAAGVIEHRGHEVLFILEQCEIFARLAYEEIMKCAEGLCGLGPARTTRCRVETFQAFRSE
ncbi:hypothetical protein [Rhizobium herbae]